MIDASSIDAKTAYIAVDRHRLNDYRPYIYRTHDAGRTWTPVANGIPEGAFVNAVRSDTHVAGLLYAATERGMYVSFNDGAAWQSFQRNLPVTSVRDIAIHGNDLVIATHGRGFYVMDDISSLRQLAQTPATSNRLFAPQTTIRFRRAGGVGGGIADEGTPIQPEEPQAPNPPVGMYIDYYLQGAASTPVTIEILGPHGHVLRSYSSAHPQAPTDPATVPIAPRWITPPLTVSTDPGAHRFVWDFTTHHDGGPLAPPGRYTVRMTVGGRTYSQSATLERDPRNNASDADLHAQYALAMSIEGRLAQIKTARARAEKLLAASSTTAAQKRELRNEILGIEATANPDDSVGAPVTRFDTLPALTDAFANLEAAIESADAKPTHDQNLGYAKLSKMLEETIGKLAGIAGPMR